MFGHIPPMTRALLIINAVVFLAQQALGPMFFARLMLWPPGGGFLPWQVLTYGFLHGGWMHIFFNMFALASFGGLLERTWGERRFLTYYLACILGAGACQLVAGWWTLRNGGGAYPTVGASGGVLGLILAFGLLFPRQRMMIFPFPVMIPARVGVALIGALALYSGMSGFMPGVAHFAHLGGMLAGWLVLQYWRGRPPFGRGPKRPPTRRAM